MMTSPTRHTFLILACLIVIGLGQLVMAAPQDGELDPYFGTGGKFVGDFSNYRESIQAVAVEPDGGVVGVGSLSYIPGSGYSDLLLIKLKPNGSFDESFGQGGVVTHTITGQIDELADVAVQSDGKIVAVGRAFMDFLMVRYLVNGDLDPTFSDDGMVIEAGLCCGGANALLIQPNGRILVANSARWNTDSTLARYLPDGTLDASFGAGGIVYTTNWPYAILRSLAIQTDHKIVVAISGAFFDYSRDFAILRYNSDGSVDTGFGNGGLVTTDFGGWYDSTGDILVQGDGKIVAVGASSNGDPEFPVGRLALARFNSDGSPDTMFGENGRVLVERAGMTLGASAVTQQANGKVLTCGGYSLSASQNHTSVDFVIARYNQNGSLDGAFGQSGLIFTDFGSGGNGLAGEGCYDLVRQFDGRIVAGGSREDTFAIARYLVLPLYRVWLPTISY